MEGTMQISVQDLDAMRKEGKQHMLLDIREQQEIEICKIDGSVHIPMNTLPNNLARVPKDQPVVVMCHMGGRSWQVTQWLRAQGYENAVNLDGGISAWAADIDPKMATY
jgi:rhodanese-related sulfurtransferase